MPKNKDYRLLIFVFISSIGYLILGYYTSRDQSFVLFATYLSLFAAYVAACRYVPDQHIKHFVYAAIGLRIILLFSTPALSDDIYRFIWDGRLLANGISPFAALPIDYIKGEMVSIPGLDATLFQFLNSPEYYTVYPPLSQLVFWLAALLSPDNILGSIIVIRLVILIAEIGSIYLIIRLLRTFQLPAKNVLLYALNPLVILELTGNLHFEAFVIFFLLLTVHFILLDKIVISGISWSIAIGFKLIPLIFLPLAIRRFKLQSQITLYSIVGIVTLLLFVPLYDQSLIDGLSSSLTLYFQKFEFNASIYYLFRSFGFWVKGYNIIGQLGPALGLITFGSIFAYSLTKRRKSLLLPIAMMWALLIYLALATTVHPWYITTLVALSVFSKYRFPILWGLLIFVTYSGYSSTGYTEPMHLIILEYVVLIGFICYELYQNKKPINTPS